MADFSEADSKVEQLGSTASLPRDRAAAACTVARHSRDLNDLAELLGALDLPPALHVLAQLIPDRIPDQEGHAPMDSISLTVTEPEPEVLVLSVAEALMSWGEAHSSTRIQGLAAKARAALADLSQLQEREHLVANGEARVKRLREQLARAEAELKTTKTGSAPVGKPTREELAQVRTWAWANGHVLSDRGMPPRHVIAAYEAATGTEVSRAA
jgi:hypothetical protein